MNHDEDDQPIDFSALDPGRSARRWEALVQQTVAASVPPSAWSELWSALPRARLTLAALAAVAVLTWLPAFLRAAEVKPTETTQRDAALALVKFHEGSDVIALLESSDGY